MFSQRVSICMIETLWWSIVAACIVVLIGVLYWSVYDYYVPNADSLYTVNS